MNLGEGLKRMKLAPSSWNELYETARRRAFKAAVKAPRRRVEAIRRIEAARVRAAAMYTASRLRGIALTSPFIDSLHPFYRELLRTMIDVDEYRICLSRIYSVSKIVSRVARESVAEIMRSRSSGEARRARRRFFARLRSLLRGVDDCFKAVRSWQLEVLKLPSINPDEPSIIIAGAPNVGKSSLLRIISRAKPEVRPYPFTTKNITVGHLKLGGMRVQAIDTPGLLDRPLPEKNPVELRAVLAMKYLNGVIVYLFDPTTTCGFPLEFQLAVYRSIREMLGSVPMLVAANKVDIMSSEQAGGLLRMLESEARRVVFISALTGSSVDLLLEEVANLLIKQEPARELRGFNAVAVYEQNDRDATT
ncbi:MAG: GTP1/OBG family GTP-binding protein [Thermoprotei archaeon]|nr:MAG: GTP1/OBG family GTP-binding protein [Thermoprotei archaeon]